MVRAKEAQIIRVIELYYLENKTQNDIAKLTGLSRPTVARLIEEGKKMGLVEIKIHTPTPIDGQLSKELRKTFNLTDAIVVDTTGDDETGLEKVSKAAAIFFSSIVREDSVIGLTWGISVSKFVDQITDLVLPKVKLIQLTGSLSAIRFEYDAAEIISRLAQRLNCSYVSLNAPLFLPNKQVVDALKEENIIREVLDSVSTIDIHIMSVGSLQQETSSLISAGHLSQADKAAFRSNGAVGHILAHLIDAQGNVIDHPFNDRILSAAPASLRQAKYAICIAAGVDKADVLLAAIKGHYVTHCVIDRQCAQRLLELNTLNEL